MDEMKKMMKWMAAAILLTLSVSAFAQKQGQGKSRERGTEWREKMQAEKIAFLTNEMSLTSEEAQAFWPVYNQAQAEKDEAFKVIHTTYKALQDAQNEGQSEAQINALLKKYVDASKDSAEIDSEYLKEYLKVIPASKVAKLFVGEEKFRKMQFQHMQGGREGQRGQGVREGQRGPGGRDGQRQGGREGFQGGRDGQRGQGARNAQGSDTQE